MHARLGPARERWELRMREGDARRQASYDATAPHHGSDRQRRPQTKEAERAEREAPEHMVMREALNELRRLLVAAKPEHANGSASVPWHAIMGIPAPRQALRDMGALFDEADLDALDEAYNLHLKPVVDELGNALGLGRIAPRLARDIGQALHKAADRLDQATPFQAARVADLVAELWIEAQELALNDPPVRT